MVFFFNVVQIHVRIMKLSNVLFNDLQFLLLSFKKILFSLFERERERERGRKLRRR